MPDIHRIDKLFLQNFKSYQDKTIEVNFGKKITLIFGKNSAGKSSLIQALGLLQQSIKYKRDLIIRTPDTDPSGIKSMPSYESMLPNHDKNKPLTLGVQCSHSNETITSRTIIKKFDKLNQNRVIAKEIELYAHSEKKKDGSPNTEKFLTIKNSPLKLSTSKLTNIFSSEITYSNNEGVYYELYDLFNKSRKELKKKLDEVISFKKKYNMIQNQIDSLSLKKNKTEVDERKIYDLNQQLDDIFELTSKNNIFRPFLFTFSDKKTSSHMSFLEKNSIKFDEFIDYLAKDEQECKKPIYYDNTLLTSFRDFEELRRDLDLDDKEFSEIQNSSLNRSTLKEFLCYVLSMPFTNIPQRNTIVWNKNDTGKVVTPEGMLNSCSGVIRETLGKLKIFTGKVQVPETFSTGLEDEKFIGFNYENLHEVLKKNIISVNKYLKKFGFDIKAKIQDIHDGKSILAFQKKGVTINLGNAGLGIENILPIITQSLASKGEILFFEEPERRAHPQLQADLADLFVECVNEKNNNQVIIETHSENMLLGVLKNIREKRIKHEDVQILYVYLENGKSDIQHLEVDSKARFKQVWRDGFFVERLNLI